MEVMWRLIKKWGSLAAPLCAGVILMACSGNSDKKIADKEKYKHTLKRVYTKAYAFEYTFEGDTVYNRDWKTGYRDGLLAHCSLKNTGKDTLFYLSSSCNGLSADVEIFPKEAEINYPFICNKSWSMVSALLPNAEVKFDVHIKPPAKKVPTEVNLDIIFVDRYISLDEVKKVTELKSKSLFQLLDEDNQVSW